MVSRHFVNLSFRFYLLLFFPLQSVSSLLLARPEACRTAVADDTCQRALIGCRST